ncbi:uncharacterized protein EV420DRAFT_251676 [Desarmillaria tabescens]|uniref:Uncharacterized protein n=1 Tax=Armillaria tabescens TaxID=1929756 RepID=A0AA39KIV1_ARMTA|nr:uncharacterized protein EV420DRAFT_251676 [Desarmillaria tabescens]KAK0460108.1 hypothetical protein EV420DRAFT_251676 [Desarmillaria tabescens]
MLFRANFAAVVMLALTLSAYAAPSIPPEDEKAAEAALGAGQNIASGAEGTVSGQLDKSHAGRDVTARAGIIPSKPNTKVPPPAGGLPDVNDAEAHISQRVQVAEDCIADSIQSCIARTDGSARDCLAGSSKDCFATLVSSITGRAIQHIYNRLEAINPNPTAN